MNRVAVVLSLVVLGFAITPAHALVGQSGYTEEPMCFLDEVQGLPAFQEVLVASATYDLTVWLGAAPGAVAGDEIAVDSVGRVYVLVQATEATSGWGTLQRTAIVRWTPAPDAGSAPTLETLLVEDRVWDEVLQDRVGQMITHVMVASSALGPDIAADDLLFVLDGELLYAADPDNATDSGTLIADVDLSAWYAHWTIS